MYKEVSMRRLSPPADRRPKALNRRRRATTPVLLVIVLSLIILTVPSVFMACSSSSGVAVTDLLDRSVEIDQTPLRIVTLHPTATETLYAAGGVAVGRDRASTYPEEVVALPDVGSMYTPSMEKVAQLEPDLVIVEALTQESLVDQLEQLGIPVVAVRATSLDDIFQSLTLLGRIMDTEETADQTIDDIQARIDAARENAPEGKGVLVFIADAEQKVYAARSDSYPGLVASLAGLDNLAADLSGPTYYGGFTLFSPELAAQSNPGPDVVLTITPAPLPAPRLSAVLSMVPGFKTMPAIKEGRVVELDPVLFLQAQGPRIADAVEALLVIMNSY
jgi:iron complex transport system substrate-binding protein